MSGSLPMPRRPLLLGLLFALSSVQAQTDDAAESLRLSGTVMTAAGDGLAIVEAGDERSHQYSVGDAIPGWGTVIRIEQGRIHLQTEAGERAVVLSGGTPRPGAEEAAEPTAPAWTDPVHVPSTPEMLAELEALSEDPLGRGDDLSRLLDGIIEITPGVEILEVNGQPPSDDVATVRMVLDELRHGNVVSLRVGEAGLIRSIYLGLQPVVQPETE